MIKYGRDVPTVPQIKVILEFDFPWPPKENGNFRLQGWETEQVNVLHSGEISVMYTSAAGYVV